MTACVEDFSEEAPPDADPELTQEQQALSAQSQASAPLEARAEFGAAVYDDGDGEYSAFYPGQRRIGPGEYIKTQTQIDDEEERLETDQLVVEERPEAILLRYAESLKADEKVEFAVMLKEMPFEGERLQGKSDAERDQVIDERRYELAPTQDKAALAIEKLGGVVLSRMWLTNSLIVQAPASKVPEIVQLDGVVGASMGARLREEYSGYDLRQEALLGDYFSAGKAGSLGNRINQASEVRIGFLEVNPFSCDHLGFIDYPGYSSRVVSTKYCTNVLSQTYCYSSTGSNVCDTSTSLRHGNITTTIAAGSIDQGQDPNITNPISRSTKSGVATEALIYYYAIYNPPMAASCNIATAVQEAVSDGVDILNISMAVEMPDTYNS